MKIQDAIDQGIDRVRLPQWTDPRDHLKLDLMPDGTTHGPWVHLYSPTNEAIGNPNPVSILWMDAIDKDRDDWEQYDGGLS